MTSEKLFEKETGEKVFMDIMGGGSTVKYVEWLKKRYEGREQEIKQKIEDRIEYYQIQLDTVISKRETSDSKTIIDYAKWIEHHEDMLEELTNLLKLFKE